ncbi:undecaprenyl-diphosphatase [Filimonas lacunae]|uniref:Undecaprenyl-diphosphatase n=1 Tax=Filimonas lacunae TaxID=477680 RepID=A0A173MM99_9BACT|nr:phosphatase PAP2 family protein [Filimonas lacunae]BAV08531.1 membrane-associated phospholipid phosphatase [Filimonas lacunae]SIT34089.1 undecaprenyl-diphosphatase [Filimonas lacunae]
MLQQWLESLDRQLFVAINSTWSVSWLDQFMMLLRNAVTWAPLYLVLLIWSFIKIKPWFWWFLALTVLTFGIADFTSSSLIKPWVGRLRPCYDLDLQGMVRSLVGCGGQYSFPSSHAANHFGLAMFWYRAVLLATGKRWSWVWIWAFVIGYAQVYVGKHFPLDIAGGAILGMAIGWLTSGLFNYFCTRKFKRRESSKVSAALS